MDGNTKIKYSKQIKNYSNYYYYGSEVIAYFACFCGLHKLLLSMLENSFKTQQKKY